MALTPSDFGSANRRPEIRRWMLMRSGDSAVRECKCICCRNTSMIIFTPPAIAQLLATTLNLAVQVKIRRQKTRHQKSSDCCG